MSNGLEVTNDVFEFEANIAFEQAEKRIALAPEVEGELVPVEGNDRDQDEEEQWNKLGD